LLPKLLRVGLSSIEYIFRAISSFEMGVLLIESFVLIRVRPCSVSYGGMSLLLMRGFTGWKFGIAVCTGGGSSSSSSATSSSGTGFFFRSSSITRLTVLVR